MNLCRKLFAAAFAAASVAPASADPLEGKKSGAEILAESSASDWAALDPEKTLYIDLERGRVVVAVSPFLAQRHVEQIRKLAREGFYDGLSFYRVIDGFVAQGGDVFEKREVKTAAKTLAAEFDEVAPEGFVFSPLPDADGYAPQSGYAASLPAGYDPKTKRAWHLHCAGAIAFARGDERDTAGTEFYVALQPQRYLDRNLTVFGRVVDGMEHLQALRRVAPAETADDDLGETIISVRVASDVPQADRSNFEILRSGTPAFAAYVEARRNRPEGFFYHRPNHIDVCQLPVPVRKVAAE